MATQAAINAAKRRNRNPNNPVPKEANMNIIDGTQKVSAPIPQAPQRVLGGAKAARDRREIQAGTSRIGQPAVPKVDANTPGMVQGNDPITGQEKLVPLDPNKPEKVRSYEQIGESLVQDQYDTAGQDELNLTGDRKGYTSLDEYTKDQYKAIKEKKALEEARLREQQSQNGFDSTNAKRSIQSNLEITTGQLSGDREGFSSDTNVSATDRLKVFSGERMQRVEQAQEFANAEVDQAKLNLDRAEREGNTILAEQYRQKLDVAVAKAKQLDIDADNAKASLINQQSVKGKNVSETIGTLGEVAADLTVDQLTSMIEGTDITLPEALLLQKAAVAQGKVDNAKNDAERLKAQAELDQLTAQTKQIGKPASVQEYEYYQSLSPTAQKQYLDLQQANKGMQFVTMEDANGVKQPYGYNSTTNTLVPLPSANSGSSDGNAVIPHEAPIQVNVGGKDIKAQPVFADALQRADEAMFKATGEHLKIGENYRTYEQQKAIRDKFGYTSDSQPSGYNGLPMAAPPGTSFHENGLAVDVQNWEKAEPFLAAEGIVGGLTNDRNHFSMGEMNPGVFADTSTQIIPTLKLLSRATDKKEIDKNVKALVAGGDKRQLQDYATRIALEDLPAEAQNREILRSNLVEVGQTLKNYLEEFKQAGGNTGIFSGSSVSIQNALKDEANPELQRIGQLMRLSLEDFARAQTGAAIQDFENKNFKKIMPTIFDSKELADAKIDAFAEAQQAYTRGTLKAKLGNTVYNLLFPDDQNRPQVKTQKAQEVVDKIIAPELHDIAQTLGITP